MWTQSVLEIQIQYLIRLITRARVLIEVKPGL